MSRRPAIGAGTGRGERKSGLSQPPSTLAMRMSEPGGTLSQGNF
jgi:hypothetical protein